MESFILKESVLNDDILKLADKGKIFKGGYIAIVEYFTYANAWGNNKHTKRFRSQKSLFSFLEKNYIDFFELNFIDTYLP